MFADSLLETSWAERGQRGWTTLTSFGVQAVIVGFLLLIPLLTTVGLPSVRTISTPITMGRKDPGPTPPVRNDVRTGGVQIVAYRGPIMQPSTIPHGISKGGEAGQIAEPVGDPNLPIGPYIGDGPNLPFPATGNHPVMPTPKPVEKVFRRSNMLEGSLIRKVEPKYPPLALAARIQGSVVLAAVISRAGTMANLRLISGHPMLVPSAIDAVKQWQYRPYILNGDVIEVETQITVNFVLGQ